MTSQLIQKAVSEVEKLKRELTPDAEVAGNPAKWPISVHSYNQGVQDASVLLPQIITGVIEEIVNKLQYRIDVNHLVKDMDIVSPQEIVDLTQDELINTLKEVVKE